MGAIFHQLLSSNCLETRKDLFNRKTTQLTAVWWMPACFEIVLPCCCFADVISHKCRPRFSAETEAKHRVSRAFVRAIFARRIYTFNEQLHSTEMTAFWWNLCKTKVFLNIQISILGKAVDSSFNTIPNNCKIVLYFLNNKEPYGKQVNDHPLFSQYEFFGRNSSDEKSKHFTTYRSFFV